MARCCYETLLSSRTFSCEGFQEDFGRAPHAKVFRCKIRIPGKSLADSPENPYYRPPNYRSAFSVEIWTSGRCGPIVAGDCYHRQCWMRRLIVWYGLAITYMLSVPFISLTLPQPRVNSCPWNHIFTSFEVYPWWTEKIFQVLVEIWWLTRF